MFQVINKKKKHRTSRLLIGAVLLLAMLLCAGCEMDALSGLLDSDSTGASSPEDATQPTVEPTLGPDAYLPNVPEQYWNHVYLDYRGKGDCEQFAGDILLTVLFVDDPGASWESDRIDGIKADIADTITRITANAAAYGTTVNITVDYRTATATMELDKDDHIGWIDSALISAGLPDSMNVNTAREESHNVTAAPVVFFTNRGGRSAAYPKTTATGREYCILFDDATAVYHELCHVFGAKDFYFPNDAADLADKYLPNSIMMDSETGVMDSFTAYLIGWTDNLSADAMAFLESTAYLTEDYISAEKEKNSYTGEVTDFEIGDCVYTGYLIDGQLHGEGKKIYNGAVYEGTWEYGYLNGQGTYTNAEGDCYTGDWVKGLKHGTGTYKWANGDSYEGAWQDGLRHGTGTYEWASGNIYTGDWVEGERTGEGKWSSASGDTYTGQFLNGDFDGQGTYRWASRAMYVGSWKGGDRSGQGKMVYANGSIYEGTWSNDMRHGTGTLTWLNGDCYEGDWVEDARSGFGVYSWASGGVHEGYWLNNQRHGEGTYTSATGKVKTGIWENDEYVE